jgi:hypothetical protein
MENRLDRRELCLGGLVAGAALAAGGRTVPAQGAAPKKAAKRLA